MNMLVTFFISACAFYDHKFFAIFFGALALGTCLSVVYALYMALPGSFGVRMTQANTANFMMATSLGQAAITTPYGYLMEIFGPYMLFVSSSTVSILMLIIFLRLVRSFQILVEMEESGTYKELLQKNQGEMIITGADK